MSKYIRESANKEELIWMAKMHGSKNHEFNNEILSKAMKAGCYPAVREALYES